MQIGSDDFFHLTYCTNIHPGESWAEVQQNLRTHAPALKQRLSPDAPFAVGLRLSNEAAVELLEEDRLVQFGAWLGENGLYVFTFNGFPYGSFHRQVVKDQVYAPDWRTEERVAYTLRLARIMAALLPEGLDGGISTSPISYKPWLDPHGRTAALRQGSINLAKVARTLAQIRQETGKRIHIDIEPEPDCLIENTAETVRFFEEGLLTSGRKYLADEAGLSGGEAEGILREHIRVCYDTCHFAVEYEEPAQVFKQFDRYGIRIGKIQISAALKADLPGSGDGRRVLAERLTPFAESTYLHQTIERAADGTLRHYPDLPDALGHLPQTDGEAWRIHYHVPIFMEHYAGLNSTQADIVASLDTVRTTRACPHLEIETYTWDVLPPELKIDLTDSIAREFEWVRPQFDRR